VKVGSVKALILTLCKVVVVSWAVKTTDNLDILDGDQEVGLDMGVPGGLLDTLVEGHLRDTVSSVVIVNIVVYMADMVGHPLGPPHNKEVVITAVVQNLQR
jgi:hypothetical protein